MNGDDDSERVVLVNPSGQPIGSAKKLATHNANTPLHLAFSCYVFNDKGLFLVTQRAKSKKVWPGVWTNSVCGHPKPDEDMIDAIKRRLDYELGMNAKDFKIAVPNYIYKTPPFRGIIEHEFCPIYVARATSEARPNPIETESYKWMDWQQYVNELQKDSNDFSWWCKDQSKQLKNHPLIAKYTQPIS